jgi:hypothetical protein
VIHRADRRIPLITDDKAGVIRTTILTIALGFSSHGIVRLRSPQREHVIAASLLFPAVHPIQRVPKAFWAAQFVCVHKLVAMHQHFVDI